MTEVSEPVLKGAEYLAELDIVIDVSEHPRIAYSAGTAYSRWFKPLLDFCFAGLLLILAAPVMIAISVMILLGDGTPIFYFQERIGRGGRPFVVYKFRTMHRSADEMLMKWKQSDDDRWREYVTSNFKFTNDPRLLPFGALLRRYSLDELPQLINVLRGEMSIIGPRPLPDYHREAHNLELDANLVSLRTSVRPGLTGLWQVSGRSNAGLEQMFKYDIDYIKDQSWSLDLKILMLTFGAVARGNGAY